MARAVWRCPHQQPRHRRRRHRRRARAAVTSGRPAKVFLMIGTNDLTAGVAGDEIVANVADIASRVAAESPDTEIFVQSILPRGRRYRGRIESLNRALRSAVAGEAVWIDLYPRFVDEDGRSTTRTATTSRTCSRRATPSGVMSSRRTCRIRTTPRERAGPGDGQTVGLQARGDRCGQASLRRREPG